MELYETELRNSAISFYNVTSGVLVTGPLYGLTAFAEYSLRLTFFVWIALNLVAFVSILSLRYETTGILLDGDTLVEAERQYEKRSSEESSSKEQFS